MVKTNSENRAGFILIVTVYTKKIQTFFCFAYMGYYSPSRGRFNTQDPSMNGPNWYVYGANNPIKFIDPLGLKVFLQGNAKNRKTSFDELQQLTDDDLAYNSKTGEVTLQYDSEGNVIKKKDSEGKKSKGTQLVSNMINGKDKYGRSFTVNIGRSGDYGASSTVCDWGNDKTGMTIQITIFDESLAKNGVEGSSVIVDDENEGTTMQSYAGIKYIELGHELIHADHYRNWDYNNGTEGVAIVKGLGGGVQIQRDLILSTGLPAPLNEEFTTVGLNYYNPLNGTVVVISSDAITENALRDENGLTWRWAY